MNAQDPLDPQDPLTTKVEKPQVGDLLPVGFLVGAYVLTGRVLGRGAFGTVYEAQQPQLDRRVAIKVQAVDSTNPEASARFLAEAKIIAGLRHRNIVSVYDVGSLPDGRLYFVMELLQGTTLSHHLANRRLSLRDALPILQGLAAAIDAIHGRGLAHRDVKPSNVVLVRDDDGSVHPKLLDFGIAKRLYADESEPALTQRGMAIGTPRYMSPEQCLGEEAGPRSDIYSFGVLVYMMLTGKVPFEGPHVDVCYGHVHRRPTPPSTVCSDIDRALDEPIGHMLAKDPAHRPHTATAAIETLARAGGTSLGARASEPMTVQTRPSHARDADGASGSKEIVVSIRRPWRGVAIAMLAVLGAFGAWSMLRGGRDDEAATPSAEVDASTVVGGENVGRPGDAGAAANEAGAGHEAAVVHDAGLINDAGMVRDAGSRGHRTRNSGSAGSGHREDKGRSDEKDDGRRKDRKRDQDELEENPYLEPRRDGGML